MSGGDAGTLPYPAGPYCTPACSPSVGTAGCLNKMATGCVIPNLTWTGYVDNGGDPIDPTKAPSVTYSLLDLYNEAHASGKKYGMINIAEFMCPGCQNSAAEMGTVVDAGGLTAGASVDRAGGILIEVLMTSGFSAPPSMANLDAWVTKYGLQNTTVADFSPTLITNNTLGRRDQAYIIDLTTMKIIDFMPGNIGPAGTSNSGPAGIARMHMLLGQ
jgi:hypothetical protein